ncbi:hydroxyacid oxidase 1-like [Nasonia vitripennis]|uniref:(S)-2-hydroxy-acid oxidase n=1 Tax=Nasonia vitripennis TaxID=7425 RepID=A0A7M7R0Z1_NASVI|nr:hydroxyacid oxidase 1-like [Nasonia vitripennis]
MPLGVSPTGQQTLAHPDGECANAKAVEAAKTIFILSSFSDTSIEDVARATPQAMKWLQMSVQKDRDCTLHCIRKAEKAGFKAIVMTVDYPIIPKYKVDNSRAAAKQKNAIFGDYIRFKNFDENLDDLEHILKLIDDSLTWEVIDWIKSVTKLPIILKGIMTSEDALLAAKHGASAILVSNHGARQLDGLPATIEVLPEIVKAVGNKLEVYLDGGVRQGIDVFVGRPMLWGLACGGEKGARAVLEIMRQEIIETLALTGCHNVQQVTKDLVVHESYYSHL